MSQMLVGQGEGVVFLVRELHWRGLAGYKSYA